MVSYESEVTIDQLHHTIECTTPHSNAQIRRLKPVPSALPHASGDGVVHHMEKCVASCNGNNMHFNPEIIDSAHCLLHTFLVLWSWRVVTKILELLLLLAIRRRRKMKRSRRLWFCPIFSKRRQQGEYHNLLQAFESL